MLTLSKRVSRLIAVTLLLASFWNAEFGVANAATPNSAFVTVSGGQFLCNNKQYKALGFTSYQLCVGSNQVKRPEVEKIFQSAKDNGLTLFRATSIVNKFGDGNLDNHLSETVWSRIDLLLDVARRKHIKVILDFSTLTYETGRHASPPFDVTDPSNFERLKRIYSLVPNRFNSINGSRYRDDPTIFGYSILGEIVPFGLRQKPDGSHDLQNESRNVDNYIAFVKSAAAELKRNDPNHLVNAGGLLHISPDGPVKDQSGQAYWKTLWADPNIDFASVHIYPNLDSVLANAQLPLRPPYPFTLPVGDWKNLPIYKVYADTIQKPFMIEEWGLELDRRSDMKTSEGQIKTFTYSPQYQQDYFNSVFNATTSNQILVLIVWQWYPGGSFDLYPNQSTDEDKLIGIFRHNARHFKH